MGIINTVGVSLGSSLNNTRLLVQKEYDKKKLIGDFNSIFIIITIIGVLFIQLLGYFLFSISVKDLLPYSLLVFFITFKAYYSVEFRININYKAILIMNIIGAIGYLIGIYFFTYSRNWIDIFIIGELFSCIILLLNNTILKEPLKRTFYFDKTLVQTFYYLLAAIISNSMTYMDRFIIFPILGADQVSVYTVASFLGKSLGVVMIPISGVLLTYIVLEEGMTKEKFNKRLIVYFSLSIVVYIGTLIFGPFITKIIYPTLVSNALPYMRIANFAAILQVLAGIIQPTLMKYAHSKWLLISQGLYLIIYFVFAFIGMNYQGLYGFCLALLFANIFRIMLINYIIRKSL